MLGIHWKPVDRLTITLYVLIIVSYPFSRTFSMILLMGLFAFWTRLPGVGVPVIGVYLSILDAVDVFSMIIAINVSGFVGAIFSVAINLGSSFSGKYTDWNTNIKDTIAQFVVCLIIPFVHSITGNIFVTMVWYTLLRGLMFFPMRLFYKVYPFPKFIFDVFTGTILLIMVNSTYVGLFGGMTTDIMNEGLKFSWTLFFIVTGSIVLVKGYLYLIRKNTIRQL